MQSFIEQYVICEDCLIGGYDFCDKCLGGGGYSKKIPVAEMHKRPNLGTSRHKKIADKLALIVVRDKWNEKIEAKLKDYYAELVETEQTKENIELLKRIISIRRHNYGKQLYQKYFELMKDSLNSRFIFKNDSVTIESNNAYFKKEFGTVIAYKLKEQQFVSFTPEVLLGFLKNLNYNAQISFNSSHAEFFRRYTQSDIEKLKKEDHLFIFVVSENEILNFSISVERAKKVCMEYINLLQSKNANGWYYI